MGYAKGKNMSGVPWHTEFLRMSEDDVRRHKNKCMYYDKGDCLVNCICHGSTNCMQYEEKPNIEVKEIVKPTRYKKKPISKMLGSFAIKNTENKEIICYTVGVDIPVNDKLVTIVENKNINNIFCYKNVEYEIINKNIYKVKQEK